MNNEFPLVSVIIPCYNQGQYLDDAIYSVLSQTYNNFEVIIVNDGSTDLETIKILKNYNQPKTILINTNNEGLPSARNNGIRISNGKYILPLDADDKIERSYLEKAVNFLESDKDLGIVYCKAQFFGYREDQWDLPEYKFPEILINNVIFCSGLFRKSDWEAVGGYNIDMVYGWEDYDFWLSIIALNRAVYRIPEILFFYRQHEFSMTKDLASDRSKIEYCYHQILKHHRSMYCENIDFIFKSLLSYKSQIEQTQTHLEQTQTHLEQTQTRLEQTQTHLEQTQTHLEQTQTHLEQTQTQLAAMKSSKFWQIREHWFALQRLIGINRE